MSSYKTPLLTLCVFGKDLDATPLISWFLIKISRIARNVTAAMLVVKNKRTSLLWELNSIFV